MTQAVHARASRFVSILIGGSVRGPSMKALAKQSRNQLFQRSGVLADDLPTLFRVRSGTRRGAGHLPRRIIVARFEWVQLPAHRTPRSTQEDHPRGPSTICGRSQRLVVDLGQCGSLCLAQRSCEPQEPQCSPTIATGHRRPPRPTCEHLTLNERLRGRGLIAFRARLGGRFAIACISAGVPPRHLWSAINGDHY